MSNQGKIAVDIIVNDKGSAAVKKFGNELESAGRRGSSVATSMMTSWKGLAGVIGAVSFAALGREVLAIADQYTLLESRLRLVTTGQENLASVQQSLYDITLRTHQAYDGTIELFTRLSRSVESLGMSQADTLQMTESINQAILTSGATAQEAHAALIQFSQGLASGALRGEEFRSVMEQTPRLARAIADGLDVPIGKLREMSMEGKLTAEVVSKALLSQKDVIQREFDQMTTTVSQSLTDLGTVVKDIIADANSSSEATAGIVTEVQNLASTIDANREGIISLFVEMIRLAREAVQIVGNFGQSIQGMRAVFSGEISFFEYATSNAEELKAALAGVVPGVKEVNDKLEELAQKRKDVAESWAFTSEARIAKQEELKSIDESVAALEIEKNALQATQDKYVDTWQVAASANDQITTSTTASVAKQVAVVQKGEVEKIKAKTKTVHKQEELDLSYGAFLARQNVLTADNYIDGWRGAFEGRESAEQEANNKSEEGAKESTSVIVDEWSNAFDSIQSTIADAMMEGEISVDSFVDIVKRALAEILSAILMSGIKQAIASLFDGDSATTFLGGLAGGISKALGMGSGGGDGVGGIAGGDIGWGKIGGGLALAGGAYGLYSGGKDIKEGNAGVGAAKMGMGAYSAYKGAVTLGLLEKGAATAAAKSIGAKLGIEVGTAAGKTLGTTVAQQAGARSAMYASQQALLSSGSTGATTAGTTTAAGASGGMGAGVAAAGAYAVVAAAAIAVAKGIYDKSQRPNADNEIDYAGITPANLTAITNQWKALDSTILASIPGFQQYDQALYSTHNSMLVATGSAGTMALQYNATAAAGHQWESVLTAAPPALIAAAESERERNNVLRQSADELGESNRLALSSAESLSGLNAMLGETAGAVNSLSAASAQAASGISGAASDISSILGRVRQTMIIPGQQESYHADGGIFTKPTKWGNHIIGESGVEALIPLPSPDYLDKLDKKIDKLSAGGGMNVRVFIGDTELKGMVRVEADRLDADRVGGGRRYI